MVFKPFWTEISNMVSISWPFWSHLRYGFCILVLNWVCSSEEATCFSSLLLIPPPKALHNAFKIGLNQETKFKTGLKQGIDI